MPSLNRRFSDLLVVGITSNDLASGAVTAADLGTIYTGNITEDGANLYFTNARAQAAISPLNYATNNYVDVSLANLVNSAPAALNTLFELSAALGNDASFASTVTNALASKADSNSLTTANVTEITNLYFSNARSRAAITAGNTLVYAEATGNITMSISGVTAGTYGGATQAAALVVDKFGRVTSASNVAISGGSGSPGGSSGQVQYNSSGTFAGSANFTWDDTNGRLGIEKNNGEALRLAATGPNQNIYTRYIGGSPSVANFYVGVDSAAAGINGQVGSAGMLWNAGNAGLAFGTNNTFRMAIDSSGKVIIGGATPLGLFNLVGVERPSGPATYTSVATSTKAQAGLNWYQDNNSAYAYYLDIFATATSESPWGGSNIRFFSTAVGTATATERMRINSSGALLLNTTSSTLNGLTSQLAISVSNSTSNPNAALNIRRSYDIHPGQTSNYYGVYSNIIGASQSSSFTTAGVYGEASIDNGNGVIGKSGTTTSNAYGVTGWASVDSNGYGNAFALRAYLTQTGPNPGNGNLYGLYIDLPNYEGSGAVRTFGVYYKSDYTGSQTSYAMYFVRNSNNIGSISTSTTATAYNTSSDYRMKENVQPMTNALATVAQLNPVTYTWKSTGEAGQGFIAHELQAVVPDAVTGEKDAIKTERVEVSPAVPATYDEEGNELTPAVEAVLEDREVPDYQGVDTSFLVATLTAAIQELKAMVDAQAAKIAALEGN